MPNKNSTRSPEETGSPRKVREEETARNSPNVIILSKNESVGRSGRGISQETGSYLKMEGYFEKEEG